ncbi:hypothetical protein GCM10009602_59940 [Nocardiopsis tropica]
MCPFSSSSAAPWTCPDGHAPPSTDRGGPPPGSRSGESAAAVAGASTAAAAATAAPSAPAVRAPLLHVPVPRIPLPPSTSSPCAVGRKLCASGEPRETPGGIRRAQLREPPPRDRVPVRRARTRVAV